MATTRGWSLKGSLRVPIRYILDLEHDQIKTENGTLTYTNIPVLSPELCIENLAKKHFNKKAKYGGYHFQFSLPVGEGSPEECLEMAKEWIEKISNKEAEYVIAVHTDKPNIHAHIVTSYYKKDGKGWEIFWKRDFNLFRKEADRICKEHGCSVLENTTFEKNQAYYEWMQNQRDSQREKLIRILDTTVEQCGSINDLVCYLERLGFECQVPNPSKKYHFTVNKSLVRESDHFYSIRIPYNTRRIQINKKDFVWYSLHQAGEVSLDQSAKVALLNRNDESIGTMSVKDLKSYFQEKKRGNHAFRIRMPSGERFFRTKFLSKTKDYSWEGLQNQIQNNGLDQSLPNVIQVIQQPDSLPLIDQERKNLYMMANVPMTIQDSGVYVSVAQRKYFEAKNRELHAKIHRMIYEDYVETENAQLPTLNHQLNQCLQERQNCYAVLHQLQKQEDDWTNEQCDVFFDSDDTHQIEDLNNQIEKTKNECLDNIETLDQKIQSLENRIRDIEKRQNKEKERTDTKQKQKSNKRYEPER